MTHWLAVTSTDYIPAARCVNSLTVMPSENAGAGIGLILKDLGGPFEKMKNLPILSGIFSRPGLKQLDAFMVEKGFRTKYRYTIERSNFLPETVPQRGVYLVRAYEYPDGWEDDDRETRMKKLVHTRLELARMENDQQDSMVFSFWPDTVLIKETGRPKDIVRYLKLDREPLVAKVMMVQRSRFIHPHIHPHACDPFFFDGFCTMGSGENTASANSRAFLAGRGYPERHCRSTAQTATHVLHYVISRLQFGIDAFRHIITPLDERQLARHPDRIFLRHLRHTCRQMIMDGPNCIVGILPDNTLFMTQDKKKRCPGVVGGHRGCYAFASDPAGLDALLPERNQRDDTQPMHSDTVTVNPPGKTLLIHRQTDPLLQN